MSDDRLPSEPLRCRPARPGDIGAIEAIFTSTVGLGEPAPFDLPASYAGLCLGWYLERALPDAAVLVADEQIVGYALVCCDERDHERWVRRRGIAFGLRSLPGALAPVGHPARRSFLRRRLLDGLTMATGPAPAAPAHAHLNLVRTVRAGRGGRLLVRHIDATVARHGLPAWYAEINAPVGRRELAVLVAAGEGAVPGNIIVHEFCKRSRLLFLTRAEQTQNSDDRVSRATLLRLLRSRNHSDSRGVLARPCPPRKKIPPDAVCAPVLVHGKRPGL